VKFVLTRLSILEQFAEHGTPFLSQQKRAYRPRCHFPNMPQMTSEMMGNTAEKLVAESFGRPRSADDIQGRKDRLSPFLLRLDLACVRPRLEKRQENAGQAGILDIGDPWSSPVPASFKVLLGLRRSEKAVDDAAQEEQTRVADDPAASV